MFYIKLNYENDIKNLINKYSTLINDILRLIN